MAFKIILIGYMGSGKSSVGKALAQFLNVSFVDLDDEIENRENLKITKIFEQKGAIYFRKEEKLILEKLLSKSDDCVLSLGGGTPCYFDTMNYLNNLENIHTIYLDVSIPSLTHRLITEKDHRPLLQHLESEQDMMEFIGKHLFERRSFYNQAQYKIKISTETVDQIVSKIVTSLF